MTTGTTILGPNQLVTGVRGWTGSDVVLTGSDASSDPPTALIYVGPLSPTGSAGIYLLPPGIPGRTVTNSTFYGPDTFLFNPDLGEGNIRAVGSYQYADSGDVRNCGMVYQGPPNGEGGGWTPLDVPSNMVGGKTVWNTIPHSTMGTLIVGNYDLLDVPFSANAFIFDIATQHWTIFELEGCTLTTAYGIWQNGIGSTHYTIVGGTRDGRGVNQGLVIDYDSATRQFSNQKLYSYLDEPELVTHFEGIVATPKGFNLAGGSTGSLALFASIYLNPDGSFSDATWVPYKYPGSEITTGNTIYQNFLMGIYAVSETAGVRSYVTPIDP